MLEAFPFFPLGGHVRVGVAIFSYDGGINFGVTGDRDTAPDIGVLCRGIERGVAGLLGGPSPKPRQAASRRESTTLKDAAYPSQPTMPLPRHHPADPLDGAGARLRIAVG